MIFYVISRFIFPSTTIFSLTSSTATYRFLTVEILPLWLIRLSCYYIFLGYACMCYTKIDILLIQNISFYQVTIHTAPKLTRAFLVDCFALPCILESEQFYRFMSLNGT